MKNNLKTYDITLITKGPVFVGDGRQIQKKEYIYLSNNAVGILEIEKLYAKMKKLGKAREFEDFILNNNRDSLNEWLRGQRLSGSDIEETIKYELQSNDMIDKRDRKMQIMSFVKDPYGNPYIPGSSLKGMLRTILISKKIFDSRSDFSDDINMLKRKARNSENRLLNGKSLFSREIKSIESKALNTLNREVKRQDDAKNDILQGFIISDSEALNVSDLCLCQKIEVHRDGQEKKLNLLRESIKPGTTIRFKLTIDSSVCSFDTEYIVNAIKEFNNCYYSHFLQKFNADRNSDSTVYIGGGSGFVSKTIIYPLLGDLGVEIASFVFNSTIKVSKNRKDKQLGVSPHILKCTHYNGKLYQFGQCDFKIESK